VNATLLLLCLAALPAAGKIVSSEERIETLKRAQVRLPVDPAAMDLLNGPAEPGLYKRGEEVPCKYEEKDPKNPLGGHSKKFPCWTPDGVRLKVKYGAGENPEIFGEVAATRLFWALGFYAERMSPVKIVCDNCPADPWTSTAASPRAKRTFEPVSLQKRLPGTEVSQTEGEGWTFDELAEMDPELGGATRAETDALKLLTVFVNHGDNTANQQRLLCPPGDDDCKRPVAYVTDLGGTFGGKGIFTSYKNWAKRADIWKDAKKCVADYQGTYADFKDPVISEEGRKLLAGLIGKLSAAQVKDLFVGARFDLLGKLDTPFVDAKGISRQSTVDDWTELFLKKRRQILDARCPE